MPVSTLSGPHQGLTLLRTVATAVVDLAEVPNPGTFVLPYPPEAQRALDRTVLACLLRGAVPPLSIADLMTWCRDRPVVDWPLDLPDDLADPDDRLVDPDALQPTRLCFEWAIDRPDSATEQIDRELVHTAIERCRAANSPASYIAFRRLLIERPVLTRDKAADVALEPAFTPIDGLLTQIYLPAPAGWSRNRRFAACGRCHTLLAPTRDGEWWCENDRCRRQGNAPLGPEYAEDDGVLLLTRPLRLFVTAPGQSELRLERRLRRLGLKPELWPGFDAYDLRITLPDGRVWAVDVKDWANPALLARHTVPLLDDPPYDEAFVVVPEHRLHRKNYLDVVRDHLRRDARRRLTVLGERQFARKVHDALAANDGDSRDETLEDDDA
jgi:hypothetical protein